MPIAQGARAITCSTFFRLLPMNEGVLIPFKGRKCSGNLISNFRKYVEFVTFTVPTYLSKGWGK